MPDLLRWALVAILVACVIAMIGWARGTTHHHGEDVGALRIHQSLSQPMRS
ncbi:hypothetical protein ACPPVT_01575 [Angustibacter sp. McL0619]|uniref:hypothetical protein n=1 Tax=Angustibacter sp. McL0619 TaxID=3415676 RepID=UPI003CF8801D